MQYAKQALQYGLGLLSPGDEFNVVAFDHEELWFSQQVREAWGPDFQSRTAFEKRIFHLSIHLFH